MGPRQPRAGDAPADSWRGLLADCVGDLVDQGRVRLALAEAELAQERQRLARLCLGAVLIMALGIVCALLLTAWLLLWCEPAQRLLVLGVACGVSLISLALVWWRWQGWWQRSSPPAHKALALGPAVALALWQVVKGR